MLEPLISVIMPCYNQARFLPEAVASLQAQIYPHWECIIINDGSSDDTAHVGARLAAGDSRVRLISQENHGLPGARNRGLDEARGQLIHFLDADDYILPEMYEKMAEVFRIRSDVVVVYSGHQFVTAERAVMRSFPVLPESTDVFHDLLERNPWPCHALMVLKATVDSVGGFNESKMLHACEDWDLWLRIASTGGRFVPVTGESACYRRYSNSMSRNNWRMLEAGLAVINKNLQHHKLCRLCKATATRGRLRLGLQCWNGFRSEVDEISTIGKFFGSLCLLFSIARADLRVTCLLVSTFLHRRIIARNVARIKSPTLNAKSGK
jgi:glycosyltransferase involved in cell wall biosynthesis